MQVLPQRLHEPVRHRGQQVKGIDRSRRAASIKAT